MTFALTSFKAWAEEGDEGLTATVPFKQFAQFNITAANTDVDLDIGDYSGTFWTAVGASAAGIVGLKSVKTIQSLADVFLAAQGLGAYVQADASVPGLVMINTAASAGGSANETLTLTGALTTDTVVSALMITEGANNVAMKTGAGTIAVNAQYPVEWTADPGAGAVVRVALQRAITAVQAGTYQLALDGTNNKLPNILFLSGDAPTAYSLVLSWSLKVGVNPVKVSA